MLVKAKSFLGGGLLALVIAVGGAMPASSAFVNYTYNAAFTDGNTATGTFQLDGLLNFANPAIASSGGTSYAANTFDDVLLSYDIGFSVVAFLVNAAHGPDYTGQQVMRLDIFTKPDPLMPSVTSNSIFTCVDADCLSTTAEVQAVDASVVGAIPLPPTVLLFGAALAGVACWRRRTA